MGIPELEVLESVVGTVAIDVVNVLLREKAAAEVLGHDLHVLQQPPVRLRCEVAWLLEEDVSTRVHVAVLRDMEWPQLSASGLLLSVSITEPVAL